jgi:outer membrane lipoprotein-sorting protein
MKASGLAIAAGVAALALVVAAPALAAESAPKDLPACPTGQEKPDLGRLLERIERAMEGRSSVSTMTMSIKAASWSRQLKLKTWAAGRDFALVRVLEGGPRETGMMTLKRQKQLWNYLPQAGRVMKLPSGMLGDSWMGSDFTNDDLVRGSSIVDDFTSSFEGAVKQDGRDAWRLVLTPKPGAVVVWGKVEMIVDRATCVPLLERFYDEDGALARTMAFGELRQVGWRQFPARMSIKPADSARETVISYDEIQLDVDVPEETFSLRRLQQGR